MNPATPPEEDAGNSVTKSGPSQGASEGGAATRITVRALLRKHGITKNWHRYLPRLESRRKDKLSGIWTCRADEADPRLHSPSNTAHFRFHPTEPDLGKKSKKR